MMMKILRWIVLLPLIAALFWGISLASQWYLTHQQENTIYIALAGPMSGSEQALGNEMRQSLELALEPVNADGGINGRPVKILTFDDQNNATLAAQAAQNAVDSPAVVVIGHRYSGTSSAGGKIYTASGMPAVTGSATADSVTQDNRWYFRVIPNNRAQGSFLANYARSIRSDEAASIVYDKSDYGISLADSFKKSFRGLGGSIRHEWALDSSADVPAQVRQIIEDMEPMQLETPQVIFMALYGHDAAKLIVAMRRAGFTFPILGGDSIGDPTMPKVFADQPEEKAQPGYFSDGIFAATPMMFDMAGEKGSWLQDEIIKLGDPVPSWSNALYYDAALAVIDALRRADLRIGASALAQNREAVRNALEHNNSLSTAVDGVTGAIYFDENHNPAQPMAMGSFLKNSFISAPVQLQPVQDTSRIRSLEKEIASKNILILNGKFVYNTRLVYTGVDFIEIGDINLKDSTFLADFYIWFRYSGKFDATDIEFPASVDPASPIELGRPILETVTEDSTYRVYRVKGVFKADYNYSDYPFDEQSLKIAFRNRSITRDNLIYVPDLVGMRYQNSAATIDKLSNTGAFKAETSWRIEDVRYYQSVTRYDTTLGDPQLFGTESNIEYSTFEAQVDIRRDVMRFMIKNLVPLLMVVLIASTAFLFSPEQLSERFGLGTGSLLTTAFFHASLTAELPQIGYVVAIEYVFYATYVLYLIIIVSAFVTSVLWARDKKKLAVSINRASAIVFESIILIGAVVLDHTYQIVPRPDPLVAQAAPQATPTPDPDAPKTVTLRLGSWRVDDTDAMNRVLAEFHKVHPNINVVYEPTVDSYYADALESQLEQGIAPDLFYLRSYSASFKLYRRGFLEPLNGLPGLEDNFSPEMRAAWSSADGIQYGVPFVGSSHGIYYNATLFKNLGISHPNSWEELIDVAETLKQKGYQPFANGTADGWDAAELIFLNLAPNYVGGQKGRLEYLQGKRCFNDEHIAAAYRAVEELAPYLPENFQKFGYDASRQLFAKAKAAMWLGGSWDILFFEEHMTDFEWDVMAVPPPQGQPGYITFHPDAGVGLSAASSHKEEARIFLEWMTTREFAVLVDNQMPGLYSLQNIVIELDNPHADQFLSLNRQRGTDIRFTWQEMMDGLPSAYDRSKKGRLLYFQASKIPSRRPTPCK